MAATANSEREVGDADVRPDQHPNQPRRVRRGPFSSLTRRILAINFLSLGIVVAGMLYLDTYRHGLIEAKGAALRTQAIEMLLICSSS